ncbi:hypothetical protein ACFQ88_14750 [Paenibacillus sp. NPDC056579]|uniref:hypothetical protein n=1 Tax=Paenibacillus sp. NPDC056579 TaxID=3345871 RepID=UPI0036CC00E9
MRNFYVKLLLIVLGIGFSIFFGVDLATRGVEQVQGPITAAPSSSGTGKVWQTDKAQDNKAAAKETSSGKPTPKPASQESKEKAKAESEPPEPKAEITEASGINRLGNKLGELLQIIAHHGVKWFVAIFDAITG